MNSEAFRLLGLGVVSVLLAGLLEVGCSFEEEDFHDIWVTNSGVGGATAGAGTGGSNVGGTENTTSAIAVSSSGAMASSSSSTGGGSEDLLHCSVSDSGALLFSLKITANQLKCYALFTDGNGAGKSWWDAMPVCEALKDNNGQLLWAHLATVSGKDEHNIIVTELEAFKKPPSNQDFRGPWIGGQRTPQPIAPLNDDHLLVGAFRWYNNEWWNIFPCNDAVPSCDNNTPVWGKHNSTQQPDGSADGVSSDANKPTLGCVRYGILGQWSPSGLDDDKCEEAMAYLCEWTLTK